MYSTVKGRELESKIGSAKLEQLVLVAVGGT